MLPRCIAHAALITLHRKSTTVEDLESVRSSSLAILEEIGRLEPQTDRHLNPIVIVSPPSSSLLFNKLYLSR